NRIRLAGSTATVSANNFGATHEPGEPFIASSSSLASLWWEWTAPIDGAASVEVDGETAMVGVFTGSSVDSLAPVADATSTGFFEAVTFRATAGARYQIVVDTLSAITGPVELRLSLAPLP